MDSNDLELERGITIYAKNAALEYKGTKINIVDTPGHADFGSEVERVLRSIDSVLLVVDAQEGPMPQTRFVLKKSLELGLRPIVVINKIDKPAADPALAEEQVLELFLELGASNEQADFPVVYAIGKQGIAKRKLTDESTDLTPLLDCVLEHVKPASEGGSATAPLRAQPFTLGYDNFLVNSSPFGGREGKFVTTRQIRDRLERELEINVGLRVDFSGGDTFKVSGRGELHIAILIENMRREGFEMQVSQPQVIFHEENGEMQEPFEEVIVDTPQVYQGAIIERLGTRKFIMKDLKVHENQVRLIFEGPTRGLLGYRSQFVLDTSGEGILSSRFVGFKPHVGEIRRKNVGSMISMASGKALGFSLWNLQERGVIYIGPAVDVYEGQVIGNTSKGEEMTVNPTKGKQLTNMRSSGADEAINLIPPFTLTIERGLEEIGRAHV